MFTRKYVESGETVTIDGEPFMIADDHRVIFDDSKTIETIHIERCESDVWFEVDNGLCESVMCPYVDPLEV